MEGYPLHRTCSTLQLPRFQIIPLFQSLEPVQFQPKPPCGDYGITPIRKRRSRPARATAAAGFRREFWMVEKVAQGLDLTEYPLPRHRNNTRQVLTSISISAAPIALLSHRIPSHRSPRPRTQGAGVALVHPLTSEPIKTKRFNPAKTTQSDHEWLSNQAGRHPESKAGREHGYQWNGKQEEEEGAEAHHHHRSPARC